MCLVRALMMVAIVKSTSTHRLPQGIASPMFHTQTRLAMPVTPHRTVSFGDFVETYEIPIDDDFQLTVPC